MDTRFSDQLRQKLEPVWRAQVEHPFVRGIGDGTLDSGRFQVWLRQSYLYLLESARLFALATARAPDLDAMKWTAASAHGVLHHQLLLHQAYAIEYGIADDELALGVKLPTTRAYTDHLLRTAVLGSYLELAAALLPGVWICADIGARLAQEPERGGGRYARWVDMYSGPVAQDLARHGRRLLDHLARAAGLAELALAGEAFAVSCRYEWMFWEMCGKGESWPV
jgi:thiaminase/transcriptional activator TenA